MVVGVAALALFFVGQWLGKNRAATPAEVESVVVAMGAVEEELASFERLRALRKAPDELRKEAASHASEEKMRESIDDLHEHVRTLVAVPLGPLLQRMERMASTLSVELDKGLELVKTTVEQLGGSIQIDTRPAAGTCFVMRLLSTL